MLQLNEILQYKNTKVIDRFLKMYDVDEDAAQDVFQETLKYLYLRAYTENKRREGNTIPPLGMTYQMQVIDKMWQAFILHTRCYQKFCDTYFSQFVHYPPKYYGRYEDFDESKEREEFNEKLSYIYNVLGEETVEKWFSTYFEKYNYKKLKQLRKTQ